MADTCNENGKNPDHDCDRDEEVVIACGIYTKVDELVRAYFNDAPGQEVPSFMTDLIDVAGE